MGAGERGNTRGGGRREQFPGGHAAFDRIRGDIWVQRARGQSLPLSAGSVYLRPRDCRECGLVLDPAWRGLLFPDGMPGSSIFGHVVCDRLGGCQYLTAPHTRTGFWSGAAKELEDEGVGNSWKDQGRVTAQLTAVRYCPLISFFCRPSTLYFPLLPAAEDQSLACAYAALILHDGGKSIEAVSLPILRVLLQKARSASSCSAPPRLGLDILFVSPDTHALGAPRYIISWKCKRPRS